MCRIAIIPSIPRGKQEAAMKLLRSLSGPMSVNNSDGLGYSAMKADGSIFGERWVNNEQAWKVRRPTAVDDKAQAIRAKFQKRFGDKVTPLEPARIYSTFGQPEKEKDTIISAMLHTRFATSTKGLDNCHPFYRATKTKDNMTENDAIALIHNGVIHNHFNWKDSMLTSNDSEAILCAYLDDYVQYNPEEMTTMLQKLTGYYAFAVMTKNREDKPIVDVVRGHRADLFVHYVDELETEVFCTRPELMAEACRKLKWHISAISQVKEDSFFRFDAKSGDILYAKSFTATEYPQYNNYAGRRHDWQDSTYSEKECFQGKAAISHTLEDKSKLVIEQTTSSFTPSAVNDKVADIIAQVNNKKLSQEERDSIQMDAIGDMTDDEFLAYDELSRRFEQEDFHSDDPSVVSTYIKSMRH